MNFALIFDMDGVVVDNTKYHALAWQAFSAKYGKMLTLDQVKKHILGRFNREIFAELLQRKLKRSEAHQLAEKKEALYRTIYAKAIRPLPGLPKFLAMLHKAGVPIALATAAPPSNVRWVLRKTRLTKYFSVIIDDTGVKRGKPHPDIFLKCAKFLHVVPRNCIVFEDGVLGILAGKRAGMKVVGVATTDKSSAIRNTDLVIKDFRTLTLARLQMLFR
ncbi:HAD family phosphatase [Candidatus Uhrbacteria bacterium]|nr:HAD family phosphatase [Candidatus Uhrbacteria bacterium]